MKGEALENGANENPGQMRSLYFATPIGQIVSFTPSTLTILTKLNN